MLLAALTAVVNSIITLIINKLADSQGCAFILHELLLTRGFLVDTIGGYAQGKENIYNLTFYYRAS